MLSITPAMRGSAVSIVTRLGAEVREIVVLFPAGVREIGSKEFRPMQVSTKPLIQWIPVTLSRGQSDWGVKLSTHYNLGLSLEIRGTVPIFLHKLSRCSQESLY
jgi:hypothetical protein